MHCGYDYGKIVHLLRSQTPKELGVYGHGHLRDGMALETK